MKLDDEDLNRAPVAAGVGVFFCEHPECRRPHVMLYDANFKAMAHFVVPEPNADGTGFMKDLQDALYRSMVERDESDGG